MRTAHLDRQDGFPNQSGNPLVTNESGAFHSLKADRYMACPNKLHSIDALKSHLRRLLRRGDLEEQGTAYRRGSVEERGVGGSYHQSTLSSNGNPWQGTPSGNQSGQAISQDVLADCTLST